MAPVGEMERFISEPGWPARVREVLRQFHEERPHTIDVSTSKPFFADGDAIEAQTMLVVLPHAGHRVMLPAGRFSVGDEEVVGRENPAASEQHGQDLATFNPLYTEAICVERTRRSDEVPIRQKRLHVYSSFSRKKFHGST